MQMTSEEAQEIQNAFLNNISHEIRTPLNAIIGCSEIISMSDTDHETIAEMSTQLRRYSNYLLKMIDNIVIISKLSNGLIKVSPSKFDLSFLFTYIYNSTKSLLVTDPSKRDRINYRLINNLGPTPTYIWSDDSIICQIVNALVDNAIKFTDDGSVTLSLSLIADSKGNGSDYILQASVSDTGIGIPEENREMIFEKFRKISPDPNRLYDGAGLGLAIAKIQTEMLNGKLSFTSKCGQGTEFTLRIPVVRC